MIGLSIPQRMKVYRMILLALAIIASVNLSAQNATRAELDALTHRVAKLEADLERVITENVNLVEQLNIKPVTSYTDENGIQWEIIRVDPNRKNSSVVMDIRVINTSGSVACAYPYEAIACDSNINLRNNTYKVDIQRGNAPFDSLPVGIPINFSIKIRDVHLSSSYLSYVGMVYSESGLRNITVKFTNIHIPW